MAKAKKAKTKKKIVKNIPKGIAHIQATFNNTIVTLTDVQGNSVCWASSGNVGFSGSKKSTPFAAQIAASNAAKKAVDCGMKEVEVYVKGLFDLLLEKIKIVVNESEENEIEKGLIINDPRFDLLGDMVVLLSRRLGLKRERYSPAKMNRNRCHGFPETDERLVGAAYWLSVMGVRSTILTKDADFLSLLEETPKWIGSGSFMPYNQLFRKEFVKNLPSVCLMERDGSCNEYFLERIGQKDVSEKL